MSAHGRKREPDDRMTCARCATEKKRERESTHESEWHTHTQRVRRRRNATKINLCLSAFGQKHSIESNWKWLSLEKHLIYFDRFRLSQCPIAKHSKHSNSIWRHRRLQWQTIRTDFNSSECFAVQRISRELINFDAAILNSFCIFKRRNETSNCNRVVVCCSWVWRWALETDKHEWRPCHLYLSFRNPKLRSPHARMHACISCATHRTSPWQNIIMADLLHNLIRFSKEIWNIVRLFVVVPARFI